MWNLGKYILNFKDIKLDMMFIWRDLFKIFFIIMLHGYHTDIMADGKAMWMTDTE